MQLVWQPKGFLAVRELWLRSAFFLLRPSSPPPPWKPTGLVEGLVYIGCIVPHSFGPRKA